MAPALRMTRSIKEKLNIFFFFFASYNFSSAFIFFLLFFSRSVKGHKRLAKIYAMQMHRSAWSEMAAESEIKMSCAPTGIIRSSATSILLIHTGILLLRLPTKYVIVKHERISLILCFTTLRMQVKMGQHAMGNRAKQKGIRHISPHRHINAIRVKAEIKTQKETKLNLWEHRIPVSSTLSVRHRRFLRSPINVRVDMHGQTKRKQQPILP
ncbi:hypothetical protein V8C40DRAFT_27783 [Trichoderma camerunense]